MININKLYFSPTYLVSPRIKLRWRMTLFPLTLECFEMSSLVLSTVQKVELSIQPVDAKGYVALTDGIPTWTASNGGIVEITTASDGLSAELVAVAPGMTQVSVSVDARMGDEVHLITGVLEITVTPAEAIAVNIMAGIPTDQ